jgi:hypothetical protein
VLDQLLLPEEELVASLGPSLDLFGYFVLGYSGVDHLFISPVVRSRAAYYLAVYRPAQLCND